MVTNRLKFQNVDQSFSLGTSTALTGGTVIKASKGTNYPQFVQKGDTQTFLNLFGAPSSTYPGVQEALEYLKSYGLWISAPGGTGSYFGGAYLTTLGSVEDFYNVTEDSTGKPSINYLTPVKAGDGSPLSGEAAVFYNVGTSLQVTGIPSNFFQMANVSGLVLKYTRTDGTAAVVNFSITTSSTAHATIQAITPDEAGSDSLPMNDALTPTGTQIIIGADTTYTNNTYKDLNFADPTVFSGANFSLEWIYNIQPYVIMAIYQNSPRDTIGTFSILSPVAVDTRQIIYPSYNSTFTIEGTGSIAKGKKFKVNFCGTIITATNTTKATVTSIPGFIGLIQTAMNSSYVPSGYTLTYGTNDINVTYNGNVAAPTISFTNVDAGAFAYTVKYKAVYTITTGTGGTTSGTVIFAGKVIVLSSAADAPAIATQIYSASLTWTDSPYVIANPNGAATISVSYATDKPLPQLAFGTGMQGYGYTLSTNPVSTSGTGITNSKYNTVTFTYTEVAYTGYNYTNTYVISPDSTKVDSQGNSLYAGTVLDGDNFLGSICYKQLYDTATGYNWNTSSTNFEGIRYVSSDAYDPATLSSVLTLGWNKMTLPSLQNVNIFFDPECDTNTATTFSTMRSGVYPFSTFLTGIRVANDVSVSPSDVSSAVNAIITARSNNYPSATGLAYYCNEFYMKESYNSTSYWGIPIGTIASMLTLIMENRLGGAAPMFTNEGSPAVGGQLSRSVVRQKYNFDATSLDTLDSAGINPIILDTFYGLMITSQKTAQSALTLTDWSYLGHQMAFDMFESEVKQQVMLPQIGKLIDNYHMNMRYTQATMLLNKRLTGPTAIWSEGQVYVTEVNTPETMAQNNFMIKIRVKVTPFSETVTLIFNNVGQTSSVTQA